MVWGLGFRVHAVGFRVLGLMVWGLGFMGMRFMVLGFLLWGLAFWGYGAGFVHAAARTISKLPLGDTLQ